MKNISSYAPDSNLVRRLLPRQQNRDPSLDQDCTFLLENRGSKTVPTVGSEAHDDHEHSVSADDSPTLVVLTPRLAEGSTSLPWYHPPVWHLAFRFLRPNIPGDEDFIRIEIVLLNPERDSASAADPTSRLYRTCHSLLETVYRYAKGKKEGYKKRVEHDVSQYQDGLGRVAPHAIHQTLVPRNEYQDLYMIMRGRFKGIADTWHEATDASKHVFEVSVVFRMP